MDLTRFERLQVDYPVSHRRKVPFRPPIVVRSGFDQVARRIQRLDLELDRFVLSKDDYFSFVQEAFGSNIHFSTKLEGNPLTLQQVRRLTRDALDPAGAKPVEVRPTAPHQEILNHLAIWLEPDAFQGPWTHRLVQDVHRILMSGVNPEAVPGVYRTDERSVYTETGQEVFRACPARHVAEEMDSLLTWKNHSAPALQTVAGAAVFYHEFESIHPFADGNGRVGRTLFHWYLESHGLPNAHLCLLEQEVMRHPETYYRVLAFADHSGRYEDLLDFFGQALLDSYEATVKRLQAKDLLSSGMDETSRRLVVAAKDHARWFSVGDAVRWVDGVGDQTVRNRLNELVEDGLLEAAGRTQGKRYRFVHPLEEVRDVLRERGRSMLGGPSARP